jgi:CxxC-x17-CxxC domain-containing protein
MSYSYNVLFRKLTNWAFFKSYFLAVRKSAQNESGKSRFMPQFDMESSSLSNSNLEEINFEDTSITCIDCSVDFVWSAGEQLFYQDKGLKNPPKRCKSCKQLKNERLSAVNSGYDSGLKQKIEVTVNCAKCDANTTVPFYPSQGRPVFCRTCFLAMNPHILKTKI